MFLDKITSSRHELLWIVRGTDKEHGAFWHYILVDKLKLPMFQLQVKSNFIALKDYGKILYSGWGSNPPDAIVKKNRRRLRIMLMNY